MGRSFRIISFVIAILLLEVTFSCKKEVRQIIPTLTTTAISSITSTTATGGGSITSDGGATVTARGVCWSVNQNPTIADNKTSDGTGIGSFTSYITGLTPGTTYYVRSYATNIVGTAYGNQIITTATTTLPTISASVVNNITTTTATIRVDISFDGGTPVTVRGVCWSINQVPTTSDNKTIDGSGIGSFTSSITGLTHATRYYIRTYATNNIGTAYSGQIEITTHALLPTITTSEINPITSYIAFSGGTATSDGGGTISSRGVCWSINQNPTISNSKTVDGSGLGTFTSSITGLSANTTYYVRAYATNSAGTAYGNSGIFKTQDIVTDVDGNLYSTVTIGSQTWMAENLKTTKYRNGNSIGTTTPATLNICEESNPKYQWPYDGIESNVATYGRLYTWYAASDIRGLCPSGWHLPSEAEWTTLTTYLGGTNVAGAKLKEAGDTHWFLHTNVGTNSSGFTALPSGYRSCLGTFSGIGQNSQWWSSTEYPPSFVKYLGLNAIDSNSYMNITGKASGYYVRCLRD